MDSIIRQTLNSLWTRDGIDLFCDSKEMENQLRYYLPEYSRQVDLLLPAIKEKMALGLTKTESDELVDLVYRYSAILINKYGLSQEDSLDVLCTLGSGIYGSIFEEFIMASYMNSQELRRGRGRNNVNSDDEISSDEKDTVEDDSSANVKDRSLRIVLIAMTMIVILVIGLVIEAPTAMKIMRKVEQISNRADTSEKDHDNPVNNIVIEKIEDLESNDGLIECISLLSLTPMKMDGSIQTSKGGAFNTDQKYREGLIANYPYREVVYYLDGQYAQLSAIWALTQNGRNSGADNTIEIFTDGRSVFKSQIMRQGSMPSDISIDVTGCKILSIMFEQTNGDSVLADPILHRASSVTTSYPIDGAMLPTWLPELNEFASSGSIKSYAGNYVRYSNTGKMLAHTLYGNPNSWKDYYLDGKYYRLSGIWCLTDTGANTDYGYQLIVYADQERVYISPVITSGVAPIPFDVVINNCQVLRIEFISNNQWGSGEFVAANLRLYSGFEEAPVF